MTYTGDKLSKRTNPRALGTNPRAKGTNPCALGTNPRASKLRSLLLRLREGRTSGTEEERVASQHR